MRRTERADAHMRWAERYNKRGDHKKAIAHFGRALDYTDASRFGGDIAVAVLPSAANLTGTISGATMGTMGTMGTVVSTAPRTGASPGPSPHQSVAEYATYVKKARELTAYSELGNENQMRFLMRMRYYHVAAVIVGSTNERDFDDAYDRMGLNFGGTSPVTLLRNVMAQTEELSSYVAAKKKDDAIRMLDNDPMRGNGGIWGWVLGAGEYTDSVSKTLRKSTPSTVADVFPALRYEPGQLSVTGNGVFDGCRTIADRCNTLATLYELYAGTTTDAGKVLVASLEYARSKSNENHDLIEWAIKDIEEAQKEKRPVDMLSVVIAATADRGEAYVIKGIRYLVVYYHAQLKHIADAHARSSNDELAAVVQYMEGLVKAVTTNTIRRACNIARMMADTLVQFEEYSRINVKQSRIFARMWVDLTYGLNDAFPGKSEKIQALYEAARRIVDATEFLRKDANKIVKSVKDALDEDKKEAERREAERREAERREAERREAERREAERREAERREAERREAERREAERREADESARKQKEDYESTRKRKEAERREAEEKSRKEKEAERREAHEKAGNPKNAPNVEIDEKTARRMALETLELSKVTEEALVEKYGTLKGFKRAYRAAATKLHTDHKKELGSSPMLALNKIKDQAELIFKYIDARAEQDRAAREQKEKPEKRNEAA